MKSSLALSNIQELESSYSLNLFVVLLDNSRLQTFRILYVHCLDVRVQLLLGTLLVVTLTTDADADSEWYTLDAGFPDLLVELWVEADVLGALSNINELAGRLMDLVGQQRRT